MHTMPLAKIGVSMNALLPFLLNWLHAYGYPALWLTVFIAAVGVPLPIGLVLLATGAFAGHDDSNLVLLIGITITASSCGDNVGYLIGRRWGRRTPFWLGRAGHLQVIPFGAILRARLYFKRRGGWAIFFSRFVFSALGGAINLLAGVERYPYRRFLLYDVAGETLGMLIPLSLGYVFGACWEAGGNLLSAFSVFALALFSIFYLVRRRWRMRLHLKETPAVDLAISTKKLTLHATPPESTSYRNTGASRENTGAREPGVPCS